MIPMVQGEELRLMIGILALAMLAGILLTTARVTVVETRSSRRRYAASVLDVADEGSRGDAFPERPGPD